MKSLLPFYLFLPSLIHAYYVDFDVDWTFQEELPKNTELVGHYKIEEKDDTTGMWRLASPSIQLAAVISVHTFFLLVTKERPLIKWLNRK